MGNGLLRLTVTLALIGCESSVELPDNTTLLVPPEGGVVWSADGLLKLTFPPGALSRATAIGIHINRETSHDELQTAIYVLRPHGMEFAAPVELEFNIENIETTDKYFYLGMLDTGEPEELENATHDVSQDVLQGRIQDFERSQLGVFALETVLTCGDCGLSDPPGTGKAFIINSLSIAPEDRGFDIDGSCDTGLCVDNYLWQFRELVNSETRMSVLGGEILTLLELSGLDTPYRGANPGLALKVYGAKDADYPLFPANNFKVPPGDDSCCEFEIEPDSLVSSPPQARTRIPARIDHNRLRTLAPSSSDQFGLLLPPFHEKGGKLERMVVTARVPSDLSELTDGLIGGVLPISQLAQQPNPLCRVVSCPVQSATTILDFVTWNLGPVPDIDLDGDGLECTDDTDDDGFVDLCCDGGGHNGLCEACTKIVPPIDGNPASCALRPEMADGYSIAYQFTAVAATIVE